MTIAQEVNIAVACTGLQAGTLMEEPRLRTEAVRTAAPPQAHIPHACNKIDTR